MNPHRIIGNSRTPVWLAVGFVLVASAAVHTQEGRQGGAGRQGGGRQGGPAGPPPTTPRAIAPMDLTGTWVSIVSEDWRWRMVTPAKGDYAGLPLTVEGRKVANGWDLARDKAAGEECKAFGAAAVMRLPGRVRISWQDDATLKVETDAGEQVRLFRFGASAAPNGDRSWQGHSVAQWAKKAQTRGLGFGGRGGGPAQAVAGGNLKLVTTHLRAGYLRKNGVPYSEGAIVTEYYNRHTEADGSDWFTVTTVVDDPRYLNQPFITSTSFRKEADGSKWNPSPCQVDPPRGTN